MRRLLPFPGSFQQGSLIRSSDPLETAWRYIERLGTIDNLTRIAASKGHGAPIQRQSSLKIRQAVELRRASQGASPLTKPLLLYYSMLNLTRGMMLAYLGTLGKTGHGLTFHLGPKLLECAAKVSLHGTFRKFAEGVGVPPSDLDGKTFSLRDLFGILPELQDEFKLLQCGPSSVVTVRIESLIGGPTELHFHMPHQTESEFAARWQQDFPHLVDVCDHEGPFTLRLKVKLQRAPLVDEFCHWYLTHDLRKRDDAYWSTIQLGASTPRLPREVAYFAAMFILSNISRYEPELLDDATLQLTDLGFFVRAFLDCAERFFPQLILDIVDGQPVFFE